MTGFQPNLNHISTGGSDNGSHQARKEASMQRFKLPLITLFAILVLAVSVIAFPRAGAVHATPTTTFPLQFTCAKAVDYQFGKVCVHTNAGAALTIKVLYCSGFYAKSKSLQGTRTADASGNYTWRWIPQTSCRGPATATVTATWHGQTKTKSDTFTVQ
jgi:hypothetical protein